MPVPDIKPRERLSSKYYDLEWAALVGVTTQEAIIAAIEARQRYTVNEPPNPRPLLPAWQLHPLHRTLVDAIMKRIPESYTGNIHALFVKFTDSIDGLSIAEVLTGKAWDVREEPLTPVQKEWLDMPDEKRLAVAEHELEWALREVGAKKIAALGPFWGK